MKKENRYLPYLIFTTVVLAWFATMYLVPVYYKAPDSAGTFGDMFGSINALFSGLAFAGIIFTILLQHKELSLQREELVATKEELKGQKLQMEKQNETLRKQAFEGTFFQMVKLFNGIINNIEIEDIRKDKPSIKGRDFFRHMIIAYCSDLFIELAKIVFEIEKQELINNTYLSTYNLYESYLGHYFRMLYNILKFVDQSDEANKKFYTDIVRAQLSTPELTLLYYNCISDMGKEKLAPLVIKYNLLKHLPEKDLPEGITLPELK